MTVFPRMMGYIDDRQTPVSGMQGPQGRGEEEEPRAQTPVRALSLPLGPHKGARSL